MLDTLSIQRELTPSPTTQGSEATRAFYQTRAALFFRLISFISGSFLVLHNVLEVVSSHLTLAQVWTLPLNHWHLTGGALAGVLSLALSALRIPFRALPWVETLGTVAVLAAHDMMGVTLLGVPAPHFDLVLTLVYMLFQMTRAVIVPSTARRTLLVCAVSAVPLLWVSWLLAVRAPDGWSAERTSYAQYYVALWCFECTIPAALAASVIYGLRQQVRRARQLGQYTLEECIGQGGMGTVYRARHALLRRPTAIKLLSPARTDESALRRFEQEVQLTSRLTHPNTVAIYDYGRTADDVFYYVMEYLDGLDLQRVVSLDGPQPPARVVHVLTQVCRALGEAHGLGLVHRDIKPANIILCERGGVPDIAKVVDFGLVASVRTPQTGTGTAFVGTPYFMAPEAIRSPERVDARSDLYAVGAVGYFLVTGRPVFEGESTLEICGHQLHSEPVPPSRRSGRALPERLEQLLLACLAKDADHRPQGAAELAHALDRCELPAWTDADARACWQRVRASAPAARSGDDSVLGSTLLEIDLQHRPGWS